MVRGESQHAVALSARPGHLGVYGMGGLEATGYKVESSDLT